MLQAAFRPYLGKLECNKYLHATFLCVPLLVMLASLRSVYEVHFVRPAIHWQLENSRTEFREICVEVIHDGLVCNRTS
jgi:hypothetical protein